MRILGRKIEIYRGETFTIAREVLDKDGIPYRLSPSYKNPYLRIRIRSHRYEIDDVYDLNYWLDLSDYRRLDDVPISVSSLDEITKQADANGNPNAHTLYYIIDNTGNKAYYVRTETKEGDTTKVEAEKYSFTFKKQFLNYYTRDWVEGIYWYDISIVDGYRTDDYLRNTFESLYGKKTEAKTIQDIVDMPTDNKGLWEVIGQKEPDLVKNVRYTAPLVNITSSKMIQQPSKLIVKIK